MFNSVITGTGAYIPVDVRLNEAFLNNSFLDENGQHLKESTVSVIEKFKKITGIRERRYAPGHLNASDIAAEAGKQALLESATDPETLDQIILSHNFGDVILPGNQSQAVPSLANRVKHLLGIRNPSCIAYDILVGCPGWVQSLIQSDAYFKAGMAKKVLLIGAETLSRVLDPCDRDAMIFSDGAGACILEYIDTGNEKKGILGSCAQTHSVDEAYFICMGKSYDTTDHKDDLYLKMKGRKVYEYALKHVPVAMKKCLELSGVSITDVHKIFIHQANEKMDEEILKRLYNLYGLDGAAEGTMPMSIQWLGNSSVATVPTLYHLVRTGQIPGQELIPGSVILFASVGAGMNINAVCYRV